MKISGQFTDVSFAVDHLISKLSDFVELVEWPGELTFWVVVDVWTHGFADVIDQILLRFVGVLLAKLSCDSLKANYQVLDLALTTLNALFFEGGVEVSLGFGFEFWWKHQKINVLLAKRLEVGISAGRDSTFLLVWAVDLLAGVVKVGDVDV